MDSNKIFYLKDGMNHEQLVDCAREARIKADEIALKEQSNVYVYAIKQGVENEDYWYSATWEI